MDFSKVHSLAIYPAIGIARVGNSPNDYFLGPLIPGVHASDPNDFRDSQGRIKRQAAQFRIFGLDENGHVLGELNESNGTKIDWKVDVANKKSAWYQFDIALDTPTAKGKFDSEGNKTPNGLPVLSQKRNREFKGEERKLLMIEARAQHITGVNTNSEGGKYELKGKIGKEQSEVYLGELRTDEAGRLIFLGGLGHSASFTSPASPLTTFANNEGWHDDTCDGPVDAEVVLPDGRSMKALGAWVLTAPPNFAVGVQAFSTGYELLLDAASKKHPNLIKKQPSFYQDIWPVLKHLSINEWVNAGISRGFGWGSAYNFGDKALQDRLNDNSDQARPLRQVIFESFRNPDYKEMEPQGWPPLYGDGVTFNINSENPRAWFAITDLKYNYLKQWASGDFIMDQPIVPKAWEEMSPEEQANGMTEAALEETLGGPFHPGCEFTWPMRHEMMFEDQHPFRIKRRPNAKEDYGVAISHDIVIAPGGPLNGSSAGDITKWMAVPWQTDTSSCLSSYRAYAGEYLPTFWPARVPNDVLTEKDYQKLASSDVSVEEKIAAFGPATRKKWLRGYIFNEEGEFLYGDTIKDRIKGVEKFTKDWGKIGILVEKPLVDGSPLFPEKVWVETGRSVTYESDERDDKMLAASDTKPKGVKRPAWVDMNPRHLR